MSKNHRDIHHAGQDDPRFVAALMNLPTRHDPDQPTGDATFGPKHRAVYNYLRRFGGWDGYHHGLTIGTVARAIQMDLETCVEVCRSLAEMEIVEIDETVPQHLVGTGKEAPYLSGDANPVRLASEGDMMKCRSVTVDADLAEYVSRVTGGTGLSFRDAVNWLVERAILADMAESNVPRFEDPRNDRHPQCRRCRGSRHVIEHDETGAHAVPCPDCRVASSEFHATAYRDGVSGRDSSTGPVIPPLR